MKLRWCHESGVLSRRVTVGPLVRDFNNYNNRNRRNVNANNRQDNRFEMAPTYTLGFMVIS